MKPNLAKPTNKSIYRQGFALIKEYFFKSDQRLSAWLLFIGAILGIVAAVALTAAFSWWFAGFWAALTAMKLSLFMASMKLFALITVGFVTASVITNYLKETLSIRWRNWLTNKLIYKYLASNNNYLELSRHPKQIDAISQRIQEDVRLFVDMTLSLSLDLFSSVITLSAFIGSLWMISGPLSFAILGLSITIPGYLVWCAILFAVVGTVLTQKISKALSSINREQKSLEADFRREMDLLQLNAENIAQEHGEDYYRQSLHEKLKDISSNAFKKLGVNTRVVAFQNFFQQLGSIFPYLAAAPLYFAGVTSLGDLMQVGFSFSQVQNALNWFSNTYDMLADYRASITRLIELDQIFSVDGLETNARDIVINEHTNGDELAVKHLTIKKPSSSGYMLHELDVKFNRGESTLIKGPSGFGKSTLFKIFAGNWKYGEGEVLIPKAKLYFAPQQPVIPEDTCKALLSFPEPETTYTEQQYQDVLHQVGLDDLQAELTNDTKQPWSFLSRGQQQRISFARALLKKPDWLFLDEATASLDTGAEQAMYQLVKQQLPNTTFVSIAHRPTVEKFHQRVVAFERDGEGEFHLQDSLVLNLEQQVAANDSSEPATIAAML